MKLSVLESCVLISNVLAAADGIFFKFRGFSFCFLKQFSRLTTDPGIEPETPWKPSSESQFDVKKTSIYNIINILPIEAEHNEVKSDGCELMWNDAVECEVLVVYRATGLSNNSAIQYN